MSRGFHTPWECYFSEHISIIEQFPAHRPHSETDIGKGFSTVRTAKADIQWAR